MTTYPYFQPIIELIYLQEVDVYSSKEIPDDIKPDLKRSLAAKRKTSDDKVVFHVNDNQFRYKQGQAIYGIVPFKVKSTDEFKNAPTGKMEFKLNEEILPGASIGLQYITNKFVKGVNKLSLESSVIHPTLTKVPKDDLIEIGFTYGIGENDNLRVRIKWGNDILVKKSGEMLGDDSKGENPLKIGDKLSLELIELKDGSENLLTDAIWSYKGIESKSTSYEITIENGVTFFEAKRSAISESICKLP